MAEYKLVPVEPTEAMLDCAVAFALNVSLSGDYRWTAYMRDLWGRFLFAAPPSPVEPGEVEALMTADAWLRRWAVHVGGCRGDDLCTCGLTRVRYETETALQARASTRGDGE